jgi:hypothetical protein
VFCVLNALQGAYIFFSSVCLREAILYIQRKKHSKYNSNYYQSSNIRETTHYSNSMYQNDLTYIDNNFNENSRIRETYNDSAVESEKSYENDDIINNSQEIDKSKSVCISELNRMRVESCTNLSNDRIHLDID